MAYLDVRISVSSDELGMFIAILIGMAVILSIVAAVLKNKQNEENDAQPIEAMEATIIDKQQIASNQIAFEQWVMFEAANGRRVRLNCKANNTYIIGDKGYLRWQGSRFLSFELGKSAPKNTWNPSDQTYRPAPSYQEKIPAWKLVEMDRERDETNN